jgi:signal transduction histidine kinase
MVVDQQADRAQRAAEQVRPRVLVVDDEAAVLLTIKGIMELDQYEVCATGSGDDALELLRSGRFDLMLTDLRLEDSIDGLDLTRELHRQAPEAVSIILTGYASVDSAVHALREGAYDYLVKPCDVLELRMTVSRGLERSRLAQELRARVAELERANEMVRSLNVELEQRVELATAELREQVAARDEFLATVSHDLKTPITFIKGMSNLRRRRAVTSPQTAPLIDALVQIENSAGRMAQQLDAIVDASKLESGRPLDLRRQPTDLVAMARSVLAAHQATTDRHVLQLSASDEAVVGDWDEVRLGRVLDNLLGNAVKFSPRGGAIKLRITSDEEEAVLVVQDRGEGIPAADLPYIFERFRRGRNVEGRIPGTGIGLYGVKRIIELHDGSIQVASVVGEGTAVTVRLPR